MDVVEEDDLEFEDRDTFIKFDDKYDNSRSINHGETSNSSEVKSTDKDYRTSNNMYGMSYAEVLL